MNSNKGNTLDRIRDFIFDPSKYRFYLAAVVFLCIGLVLVRCTDTTAQDENPMSGVYTSYKEEAKDDKDSELTELFEKYYKAYADGDVAGVKKTADPVSDREASYIEFLSQYIEAYNNIKIYSKRGLDNDSYLVSASYDLKIKDFTTEVAGLDFFYVRRNDKGKLFIDNLYSTFNTQTQENEKDDEVVKLEAAFAQQDDVQALEANIQQKFNEAIMKDNELNVFLTETMKELSTKWSTDYQAKVEQEEKEKAEAKKKQEEEEAAAKQKAEDEKNKKTMYTTQAVTVYDSANTGGNALGNLEFGAEVTKYAEESGFARIAFNDANGYVEAQYLADTKPAETQEVEVAGVVAGEQKMLTNTVRVRAEMNETASVVEVAYAGSTVTIGQNFASGWTSVTTSSGKSGYVRSDLLQ